MRQLCLYSMLKSINKIGFFPIPHNALKLDKRQVPLANAMHLADERKSLVTFILFYSEMYPHFSIDQGKRQQHKSDAAPQHWLKSYLGWSSGCWPPELVLSIKVYKLGQYSTVYCSALHVIYSSPMDLRRRSHFIRQGRVGRVQTLVPLPTVAFYKTRG
jgi:hypothetical protein